MTRDHGTTDEQITEWDETEWTPEGETVEEIDGYTGHHLADCKDALCPHQRLLGY